MKTKSFILFLILANSIQLKSQTSEKITGFTDIKLSYTVSFISDDPFFTPFGSGLELGYSLGNRFSFDFGFTIKPTKKLIKDNLQWGDWGFTSTRTHSEVSAFFMDFPVHFNYQLIKTKPFKLLISAGPRTTYFDTEYILTRTYDDQEPLFYKSERNNISVGLDFGIVEFIKLSDKIGVFASQYYGHYLIGASKGFESTDLKIGLTYCFK
jgi:hypothetical protein